MNEQRFEQVLLDLLTDDEVQATFYELTAAAFADQDAPINEARTFEDAELGTTNKGVELTLDDGSVFQLTIHRYR